jgi:hypothetical protein
MVENALMLDSIGLRELAEYASSLRHAGGDPAYFIVTEDPKHPGKYAIRYTRHPPKEQPDRVIVPADTAAVAPRRPKVKSVTVTYEDPHDGHSHEMVLDGSRFDALFWSEAAVEKFLFPYYASKYQWAAADWLSLMASTWYGFVPGMEGPDAQEASNEIKPMAMVHYPRSDYGEVEDGGVVIPGNDVHVLTAEEEGEPILVPLWAYR